ncbi:anti-sigma factor [Pseudomonas sp.]|uniref:anti-sigma factor family protein n=1 Tax=Pseudomonas sp. TaxID=306 RepID=UPI00261F2157|nr:anti-sigma factor [Pseudomonas sp.]
MSKINCEHCREWMSSYLDNELDTQSRDRLSEHLLTCTECQQRLETLRALKAAVQHHSPYYTAPESLTKSLRLRLTSPAIENNDIWRTLRLWLAPVLSGALLAVALFLYVAAPSPEDNWTDEAVSSHVRSLMGDHLMDVASSDKHTVKPWFTGKLDFSPPVYDFSAEGFPLLGARLDYLQHQTAAALSYRHDKHIINAFVVPTAQADSQPQSQSSRGYNIVSWRQNHMHFIVVSDLDKGELEVFSQLIQRGL